MLGLAQTLSSLSVAFNLVHRSELHCSSPVLPIQDVLNEGKKATGSLPDVAAEETRQETARILKRYKGPQIACPRQRNRFFIHYVGMTKSPFFLANEGKATVVLSTENYTS
jgi:hypothetical protein